MKSIIRRFRRLTRRFDIEKDEDLIANEIVGEAGIGDIKVAKIDPEFGLGSQRVARNLDCRGEGNALRDAVLVEVSGYLVACIYFFNPRGLEG